MILHTPVVIEVEDEAVEEKKLEQYSVDCPENDKFLLLYVMLKLNLVNGKTIIFVNDINRCFRVKLFLERFSIRSAVLNSELPQASRRHIVEEGTLPFHESVGGVGRVDGEIFCLTRSATFRICGNAIFIAFVETLLPLSPFFNLFQ